MSAAGATSTWYTVKPLIVMPRMADAAALAASAPSASFTPPALPRPPACTCAFTTTLLPNRAAMARTSSGLAATSASGMGTPNRFRISRA